MLSFKNPPIMEFNPNISSTLTTNVSRTANTIDMDAFSGILRVYVLVNHISCPIQRPASEAGAKQWPPRSDLTLSFRFIFRKGI